MLLDKNNPSIPTILSPDSTILQTELKEGVNSSLQIGESVRHSREILFSNLFQ